MTRTTNARIAGIAFLLYIAAGVLSMVLFAKATGAEGIAAKLARIAEHTGYLRTTVVLALIMNFCALALGVTLWSITRDEDRDLSMMGLVCRVCEGVVGAAGIERTMELLWLATASGATAPDAATVTALGPSLLREQGFGVSAIFFAVGSTCFAYLLLRGRMIPTTLAWIGVASSILLVVLLPFQVAGLLKGPIGSIIWAPMAIFEVWLAVLFLVKGVGMPRGTQPA